MRTLIKLLIFILSFVAIERLCHRATRGFALQNIVPEENFCFGKTSGSLPNLSQKFYFLDSGLEFYAFKSEDKNLVLKFFKLHHVKQADFFARILPFFKPLQKEKRKRLESTCESSKIAFHELQEETGLLYVHLAKESGSLPIVNLIDKLGISHEVDLSTVPFLVQKKAEMLDSALQGPYAKLAIHSLVELIMKRASKGIHDRDPTLLKNVGFIEGKAIAIDIGSFSKDSFLKEKTHALATLFYETLPLRCYLAEHRPDLLAHLASSLDQLFREQE